ncbi:MAG: hypothetical protein KC613_27475 [Myxococcales bacterium]|nr:hypothetical protein [Myxococcales bacterium]MCB9522916.1 hypothetical protein [Myxococcales bacterium]
MTRATVGLGLALGLGALGCDDDGTGYTPASGAENGARCIQSVAGASGCLGGECLGLPGAQIGMCTEACSANCRYGGVCLDLPDRDGRFCIQPCATGADCAQGFECQPIEDAVQCDAAGCGVPDVNAFCVAFRG